MTDVTQEVTTVALPSADNVVPNPGSDEAAKQGCICARMDNAYGRGYMGGARDEDGEIVFVITVGCPVHAPAERQSHE